MSFDRAFALTIGEEGGVANVPGDKGGHTYRGVTQQRFTWWLKSRGEDDRDVITMTDEELHTLAYDCYWIPAHCDSESLSDVVGCLQFDTSFNSGPSLAIRLLQEACGAEVDGVWGAETMAKSPNATLDSYLAAREAFYRDIVRDDPTQLKFLNGWMNRLADLRKALS